MYISELEIDLFGEVSFATRKVPVINENKKSYIVDEDDDSYHSYIPRGQVIFKDLGQENTKRLREDGYAVEGYILYTGNKSCTVFTKDPIVGKKIVQKEMLRILERDKEKINKHIEIISNI